MLLGVFGVDGLGPAVGEVVFRIGERIADPPFEGAAGLIDGGPFLGPFLPSEAGQDGEAGRGGFPDHDGQ